MKKWPLTVGFNVGEPPPPHNNYWLNSVVIAISQLPLDLGEVGLGSRGFVPCCVHGWMLWAASSSAQLQHNSWTKQCPAQSLNLIRISLQCWGDSVWPGWFLFSRTGGVDPFNTGEFFHSNVPWEYPLCTKKSVFLQKRILPAEGQTCQQLWTRSHCKWNMWKQEPIH